MAPPPAASRTTTMTAAATPARMPSKSVTLAAKEVDSVKKATGGTSSGKANKPIAMNGTLHPAPVASTSTARPSHATSGKEVKMTALEVLVHNAILNAPKRTMFARDLSTIEGADLSNEKVVTDCVNSLLRKSLLKTGNDRQGEVVITAVPKTEARDLGAMTIEEKLVLDHISNSGNNGIWTRVLKTRTNLHQTVVTRTIKTLEQKKLIKNIKSVKHPTRKIYMLQSIIPSVEVTGGPWYNGSDLDTDFITMISEVTKQFIRERSFPNGDTNMIWPMAHTPYLPTANDVLDHLERNKILVQVDLDADHVEKILDLLVWDGDIERIWMGRYAEDGVPLTFSMETRDKGKGREHLHVLLPNSGRLEAKKAAANDDEEDADAITSKKGVKRKSTKASSTNHKSKRRKRAREGSTASADIDAESDGDGAGSHSDASTDSEVLRNQMSEDEDYQPHLRLSASTSSGSPFGLTAQQRNHKRPGPAGSYNYWVYRTCLDSIQQKTVQHATGSFDKDGKPEIVTLNRFDEIYDLGFQQTPCGVCPVSEFCNNRGRPKTVPLPGEKDMSDVLDGGPSGGGGGIGVGSSSWRKSRIVRDHLRELKISTSKATDQQRRAALLKMKVPAGSGEQEDADGVWSGGGQVGGKIAAPVNPTNCLYLNQWFGDTIAW